MEEIILNVKKPRFGKKDYYQNLFTDKFFIDLKSKNINYKKKTNKELDKDWELISKAVYNIVLTEADGIKLSPNIGELKLGLLRIHNVIDRKESNIQGKIVKYINSCTNKKPGKIVWRSGFAKNNNFYLKYIGFTAIRWAKMLASKNMTENGGMYKDITTKNKFIK